MNILAVFNMMYEITSSCLYGANTLKKAFSKTREYKYL